MTPSNPIAPETPLTRASLSIAQQRLIDVMHDLQFGRIEDVSVVAGEPVFRATSRIIREIKLGAPSSVATAADDYLLKSQVVELFQRLNELGDGMVELLEVRHGLPFRLTIEEHVRSG